MLVHFFTSDVAGAERSGFAELGRGVVTEHHRLGGQHRLPAHHRLRLHDLFTCGHHQGLSIERALLECAPAIFRVHFFYLTASQRSLETLFKEPCDFTSSCVGE